MRSMTGWFMALAMVVAGCGGAAEAAGPPDIQYGRDVCFECNMIISEVGHAAAYRLDDGTEKVFDDIGGMVKHGREHQELADAAVWVHDLRTEEWVEADRAFYVPTVAVASPMGHGIFAFAARERADEFAAAVDGEVIDWQTVMALPEVDGRLGDHHTPSEHGDEHDTMGEENG